MGVVGTPTKRLVSTGNVRRRRRPPHSLLRAPQSCLGERFVSREDKTPVVQPEQQLCNLPRRTLRALLSQTWGQKGLLGERQVCAVSYFA